VLNVIIGLLVLLAFHVSGSPSNAILRLLTGGGLYAGLVIIFGLVFKMDVTFNSFLAGVTSRVFSHLQSKAEKGTH